MASSSARCSNHPQAAGRQELCPSRLDAVWSAPVEGFDPATADSLRCSDDGSWRPPGTNVVHRSHMNRSAALRPSYSLCRHTRWASFGRWRTGAHDVPWQSIPLSRIPLVCDGSHSFNSPRVWAKDFISKNHSEVLD